MAGKTVTLTIKVNDSDVDKTKSKLKGLGIEAKDAEAGTSGLSGGLSSLQGAAIKAGPAIAAVGTVIATGTAITVAAAREAYNLAKAYADIGSEVGKYSEQTGLYTETISALRFQAQKTDTDFNKVTGTIDAFVKKIGDAAKGSDSANASLARLGIDGKKAITDIEGAYRQALETIAKLPPGVQQAAAANDAFGDSGQDVINFVNSFDGDLGALIKTADEYGFVINSQGVAASREFKDALKEVEMAGESVKIQLGRELLPVVAEVFRDFSGWIKENKKEIKSWAEYIAKSVQNATDNLRLLVAVGKDAAVFTQTGTITTSNYDAASLAFREREYQRKMRAAESFNSDSALSRALGPSPVPSTGGYNFGAGGGGRRSRRSGRRDPIRSLLSSRGFGFTTYNRTGNDQFGTRQTIANIEAIGKAWARISNVAVSIGDISRRGGGRFAPHRSHRSGDMADIRPFRLDGRNLPTNINDRNYDRSTTRRFIQLLKQMIPSADVLFNDPVLIREGLTRYAKGHGNHLHVNKFGATRSNELKGIEGSARYNREISNRLTAQRDEQSIREEIEGLKRFRYMPSLDLLKDYHDLLKKDAEKAGTIKPTLEEVKKQFDGFEAQATVSDKITFREPSRFDQEFVARAQELRGQEAYVDERRANISAEILLNAEAYRINLKEQIVDARVENALVEHRNVQEEARLENILKETEQKNRLVDLEKSIWNHGKIVNQMYDDRLITQKEELDALGKQYEAQQKLFANPQYRQYEKDISVLTEKLALQQDIFDLENKIATQGENAAERYRRVWLEAIFEVRDANITAVEDQIRAQVRLGDMMNVHTEQIRANVLDHLSRQKSLTETISDEIIGLYDEIAKKSDEFLDKSIGRIPIIGGIAKTLARNTLTNVTRNLLDTFLPGIGSELTKTDNPVARPIVDKIDDTNKHLADIKKLLGAGQIMPGVPSSPGFQFGGGGAGIVSGLLRAFGIGGGGYGTPSFNPNAGGGADDYLGAWLGGGLNSGGRQGSIWSRLTGPGGIFGKKGFGNNVGTYSAIGTGVSLLGNLIGGNAGGFLSGAGSGAALGAQIGSIIPGIGTAIGAGVGALVGGIAGLFGANSKRRKEEKIRNQAMLDTLKALNDLKAEVNRIPPQINLDSVPDQARGIEKEYFDTMRQLKDKKTRNIALKDGRERVSPLVQEIIGLVSGAKEREANRQDTASRFIGEFASGAYISREFMAQFQNFKRRNGMLPGSFSRGDVLPSLLAGEELVINPRQRMNVIRNAGFDAFENAGIPNYRPQRTRETPAFSSGASFGSVMSLPSGSIHREQVVNMEVNIDGLKETVDIRLRNPKNTNFIVGKVRTTFDRKGREVSS